MFRNHLADLVAHGLAALLRNHLANLVGASALLRNHLADLVAASLGAGFAHILGAADLFLAAGRNPNLLAALTRRALAAYRVALARAVRAAAGARIVNPSTWFADNLADGRTRNFVNLGFPMATGNFDRLRVVHRHLYVVGDFTRTILPHWLAYGVAASAFFPNRLANRVANFFAAGFPNWLAHRVGAATGFPHWLAYGVAASAFFPHWLAHGVAASAFFPHWLAYGVANFFAAGFPNRLAHRVGVAAGFPHWLAYRVANFLRASFGDVLNTVDHPIFANSFPASFVASYFLSLVLDAANCFHNCVALHLTTRCTAVVPRGSTEPGFRFGWDKRKQRGCGDRNHPSSHFHRLLKNVRRGSQIGWSWQGHTGPPPHNSGRAVTAP